MTIVLVLIMFVISVFSVRKFLYSHVRYSLVIFQHGRRRLHALLVLEAVFILLMIFPTLIPINAQTTEGSPLTVVFAVEGVNLLDRGEILSWVTANNVTRTLFYNATAIDLEDTVRDGIVEPSITFPNQTAHSGDKFRACTVIPELEKLVCSTGFKSPSPRAEFVSVVLSDTEA